MSIQIKKGNTGSIDPGVEKRIDRHESIIYAVIIILIFLLGQLLIDSFRFSGATYKEYSQKIESVENIQNTNEQLLNQIKELSQQAKEDREIIKQLLRK